MGDPSCTGFETASSEARARSARSKARTDKPAKATGPTKSVSLSALNRHHGATDLVGPGRFELPTSPLSGVRSNQLSYGPEPLWFETPTSRQAFTATRRRRTRPVRQFIQGRKRNEGGGACLTTKPQRRPHGACMHDAALTDWRLGSRTVQYGCPIDLPEEHDPDDREIAGKVSCSMNKPPDALKDHP